MPRRVFFSFHYRLDHWRASTVRSIGKIHGNQPAHDNDWEAIKQGGAPSIRRWIDGQMRGKSCAIVLIGSQTANRRWVKYEIKKAWNDGKGLLGIYIHGLKDNYGKQSEKGRNPFSDFHLESGRVLSSIINSYDRILSFSSRGTYAYIAENIEDWIEEALRIRANCDVRLGKNARLR